MNKKALGGSVCLLLAAIVWGFGFVAQDMGAEYVDSFTFLAARSLIAAAALGLLWLFRDLFSIRRKTEFKISAKEKRYLAIGGPLCGMILCLATCFQQLGIAGNVTSPGKDAFITALYIVLVPIFSLFFGKRVAPHMYLCVGVALVGLWLLCMNGSQLTTGDIQMIACSLIFSFHIIAVGFFSPHVDGIRLSCLQFLTVGVVCTILAFLFERPTWSGLSAAGPAILYSGLISAGVGYTLQIIGQRHTPETVASLLMSLESVFAVMASAILLPELTPFTLREGIGMAVILAAIVVSQLPIPYKKPSKDDPKRS
ncbi:MAG: DMT family transporter [Clostridia bacterium]|nr:DMT family transporter [Clostridia bacterium]